MKRGISICIIFLLFCAACNTAMRDGLKAGMPNTLKLPNGEVIYDLAGNWDIVTRAGTYATFKGVIDMKQEGDRFVGSLQSGNYPVTGTSEKVRGKLRGGDIEEIQFNTPQGWINSTGEIAEGGKVLEINAQITSENMDVISTLRKK